MLLLQFSWLCLSLAFWKQWAKYTKAWYSYMKISYTVDLVNRIDNHVIHWFSHNVQCYASRVILVCSAASAPMTYSFDSLNNGIPSNVLRNSTTKPRLSPALFTIERLTILNFTEFVIIIVQGAHSLLVWGLILWRAEQTFFWELKWNCPLSELLYLLTPI